eukprot:Nk52_evm92s352 gene=Nk52_evmTU92s352
MTGKRWRKGGSGGSNPECTRHRQAARQLVQQRIEAQYKIKNGNEQDANKNSTGLTQNALKAMDENQKDMMMDGDTGTYEEFMKSRDTSSGLVEDVFASVIRHSNSNLASHREACAVLAVVQEVIKEQGAEESEAAYFAALMSVLDEAKDQESGDQESSSSASALEAIVQLLALVLPRTPSAVLKSKFTGVSTLLMETLAMHADKSSSLVRHILQCLGGLLEAQEAVVWGGATGGGSSSSSTRKVFQSILVFTLDMRPKVRKTAQECIQDLVQCALPPARYHPAAVITCEFILEQLSTATKNDSQTVLHLLGLVKKTFVHLPDIRSVSEAMLKLLTMGHQIVNVVTLNCFKSVLEEVDELTGDSFIEDLLQALYTYQPNANDVDAITAWSETVTGCLIRSFGLEELSMETLNQLVMYCKGMLGLMLCDNRKIVVNISKCVVKTLSNTLSKVPLLVNECVQNAENESCPLAVITEILKSGLTYRYQSNWDQILNIVAAYFKSLGYNAGVFIEPLLVVLDSVYASNAQYLKAWNEAVGAAMYALGPEQFLNILPLDIDTSEVLSEFPRGWILLILRDYTYNADLGFFFTYMLPLSEQINDSVRDLKESGRELEAKTYEVLYNQVWDSFPAFCKHAYNVENTFNYFAKQLGQKLSSNTESAYVKNVIFVGLSELIEGNQKIASEGGVSEKELPLLHEIAPETAKVNLSIIGKYAKNFLPILFNLYSLTKDSRKNVVIAVIQSFIGIAESKVLNVFFKNVVKKMLDKENENTGHDSMGNDQSRKNQYRYDMMDLILALTNHLDVDNLGLLYRVIKPLIQENDPTLQKKSYKALMLVCESDKHSHVEFSTMIKDDLKICLSESQMTSSAAAKHARLRCLQAVVGKLSGSDLEMVPDVLAEVILCTKEVKERTRTAAYETLVFIANHMKQCGERLSDEENSFQTPNGRSRSSVNEFFQMVVAGLAGQTPHMISATINAMSRISYDYREDIELSLLKTALETVLILLGSKSREIVKSALGYVKVSIVIFPKQELQEICPSIVTAILMWGEDSRNNFKMKVRVLLERLIRKYGYEYVLSLVPEEHKKLLIHIRKACDREKKEKQKKRESRLATQGKIAPKKTSALNDGLSDDDDDDSELSEILGKLKSFNHGSERSETWIREADGEDEPLNFLDPAAVKNFASSLPKKRKRRDDDDDFEIDDDGKLLISDDEEGDGEKDLSKFKKKASSSFDRMEEDSDEEEAVTKSKGKPSKGINVSRKMAAKGDVKRKGDKHDPYSFIPLNHGMLNKRKKNKAEGQFKGLVKAAKKGSVQGNKRRKH